MTGKANNWEFKHRVAILIASQVVWFGLHGWKPQSPAWMIWLGATLCFGGAWMRVLAAADFRNHIMVSQSIQTSQLVSGGIYAHVRNPLYVGSVVFLAGIGMVVHPVTWFFFAAFNWYRYQRIILAEEGFLRESHGQAFDDYCQATGRWIPVNWRPQITNILRINSDAVFGNMLFVGAGIGFLLTAATGKMYWPWIGETGGGLITAFYILQSRAKSTPHP